MRILLTNDDGIFAEGLQVLAREIEKIAETSVVAPDHEQSATGHAITMHRPIRAERVKYLHSPELPTYAVNGTPADCVKLAVEAILPHRPDLVISGINRGANLGTDVLYSGTVSAAIEGVILGIPAIAVSLAEYKNPRYEYAAEFIARLAKVVTAHGAGSDTLLNVNVPGCDREKMQGVAVTKLGVRQYKNAFEKRTDPRGRTYYWLAGQLVDVEHEKDTDVAAINACKISITPIQHDLTNYALIDNLREWSFEL
ncbi:5'/3'-nucleotidase SurE [Dethiobacter alkaliphilus]|uniref:5'-nucleotidase SurE n=1 Tax=Dethiobacter alkaliphilus AHT 1 TaxID=555088 RepID=C0GHU3_DETAL|nr:5'/3'-nucleotidase SurE [Dethiobacter alkaliphilus]EEG77017.1 stationary-phase survival protein SurE [Dethiobacter alkaliphilus AHT 1]